MNQCPFCDPGLKKRILRKKGIVYAVADRYPVTPGHTLIIPIRHSSDFFTMTKQEQYDMLELLDDLRSALMREDSSITGFNVGTNCGLPAGQTVMHAHVHLIPRRKGDSPNPVGGVRWVIPSKGNYKPE